MGAAPSTEYDPERKIWSGPNLKHKLFHPDVSIGQVLYDRIRINPKNVLQISDSEGITFTNEQALSMSVKVALSLLDLKLKQSDFIGIMATNTSYLMPLCYGSFFASIPFHPLDVCFDKEMVLHCWSKSRPKILFCDASVYDLVKEVVEELQLNSPIYIIKDRVEGVKHIEDMFGERGLQETFFRPQSIENEDQTALILCSSGSTGLPKAVTLSHHFVKTVAAFFFDTCEDVFLTFNSLFWVSGLNGFLNTAMTGSTRLVTCESFNPELCLNLVDKYKVTKIFLLPMNLAAINNCPDKETKSLKSLTAILSAGAKIPDETLTSFKKLLNPKCLFIHGYACTEKGGIATSVFGKVAGSCGKLLPSAEVKIVDDNGNPLGPNEDGEIVTRNRIPWKGYYNDEEATKEVYDEKTDWYRTGDLGHFDDEGNLFIVDRIKEIMKSKGFHISPTEIEVHITKLPQVSEVCVVGIPDVNTVNLPAAMVIKAAGSEISEEEILKHVSENMHHFKHLTGGVYFVEQIPRTISGKLLRRKARVIVEELYKERLGVK
ncbi:hypothetical protein ACFFRR_002697 [Megaselia abdita]